MLARNDLFFNKVVVISYNWTFLTCGRFFAIKDYVDYTRTITGYYKLKFKAPIVFHKTIVNTAILKFRVPL